MSDKKGSPKLSLTHMDFGAGPPSGFRKKTRKASFFPNIKLQEAFKKVLAAIVAIKSVRPRIFSGNSDKNEEAQTGPRGTTNPMINVNQENEEDDLIFGAYSATGASNRKKKRGSSKPKSNVKDDESIPKEEIGEDDLECVNINPKYAAKVRKQEKLARLEAGEDLESIERDLKKRKPKKKVYRSPMPPGA